MTSGPYRDIVGDRVARYICIVCYRWAAASPGICGDDSAPLHDISKPEVLQMMHEEANRRLMRSAELEATAEPLGEDRIVGGFINFILFAIAWVLRRPRPGAVSARATLAARRKREGVPLLVNDSRATPDAFEAAGEDPDMLDAQGLVRWFGAKLHD